MATDKNPNKGTSLDELITTLVQRAPELHAAGVTSISHGDFAATLERPPVHADADDDRPRPRRQPGDPLKDPTTFPGGQRRGGFERPTGRS